MKTIFLDIDGTLYSPEVNGVPESALKAMKKARENGHRLFVCTGRSLSASKLFLNFDVDGFVFSAGAVIYVHGQRIYDKSMSEEEIEMLLKIADQHQLGYCLEGLAGAYYNDIAYPHVFEYFSKSVDNKEDGDKIMQDNCYFPLSYRDTKDKIAKICFYSETLNDMREMEKDLPQEYQCLMTLTNAEQKSFCGEISHKSETKSTAAKIVCDVLGTSMSDAIGIGDSSNDVEMIRDCGIGIAMGNASENAKAVADYITTDIMEDGIYNAFKHFEII